MAEWLTAYGPELNPVEYFWEHLDDWVMANCPQSLENLLLKLGKEKIRGISMNL
jgi:transposase